MFILKRIYEDLTSYLLMNKNTPVLQFFYDTETHSIVQIESVFHEAYAPIGITEFGNGISRKKFNTWWNKRAIPASRENFSRIMQQLGIQTSVELLEKCSGFSLSDQYWIKNYDSSAQWKDLNFFDNPFSEDIGKLLLGQMEANLNLNQVSPDNASDGNLPKKWKIMAGDRYLIKGGNSLNNQEPYNEVIATRLYERILSPGEYVPYFLIQEDGKHYSACKTMVTTDEELVSAWAIDNSSKKQNHESLMGHYISTCESVGITDVRTMLCKMLTCDYILANYDRHYRNFGAIRNVETIEWKGFAPIFDTGSSLWAKYHTKDISAFQYPCYPFKSDPKEQFKLVFDLSWLDEHKLLGFEEEVIEILSQNPYMDEQRISVISGLVKDRIQDVLTRKQELEHARTSSLDTMIQVGKERLQFQQIQQSDVLIDPNR